MSDIEKMMEETYLGDDQEHIINIPLYLVLTIITCGVFNLYWNNRQMEACNDLSGEESFSFWLWILLSIVTCGIYHVYYQYKMGSTIIRIQQARGQDYVFDLLPVISLVGTIFGLSIVVDCIHQHEINKLAD